jgi:hypothetical protein
MIVQCNLLCSKSTHNFLKNALKRVPWFEDYGKIPFTYEGGKEG